MKAYRITLTDQTKMTVWSNKDLDEVRSIFKKHPLWDLQSIETIGK